MLYEIKNIKQIPGQNYRRWFTSDYFDLFVWYGKNGRLTAFQLTYDKSYHERAVTWTRQGGLMHTGVNDGEDSPLSSMTPILESDGIFPKEETARRFQRESGRIDRSLARFIYQKLINFPDDRNI